MRITVINKFRKRKNILNNFFKFVRDKNSDILVIFSINVNFNTSGVSIFRKRMVLAELK